MVWITHKFMVFFLLYLILLFSRLLTNLYYIYLYNKYVNIGGVVRNVLAPLLAGGCVICCGGFNPLLFWDTLCVHQMTRYYASPTMHHAILNETANW